VTKEELIQCHQTALKLSELFQLPLFSTKWRGKNGDYIGGNTGSSLDFKDHRIYAPGDDPRHINWAAYARTGSYTLKQYSEEVRPMIDIVIDVSESMFFDTLKSHRTAEILYLTHQSSHRSGASVVTHFIHGNDSKLITREQILNHSWFEIAQTMKQQKQSSVPDLSTIPLRTNTIRVFISDLLYLGDPSSLIRTLSHRHGSSMIFAPFLTSEESPNWSGNYEFIDAETSLEHSHRIEPAILNRYVKAYTEHFSFWKDMSNRHQTLLAKVNCNTDLQTALKAEALIIGALQISN
jgi:Protein of unknown function DUF58